MKYIILVIMILTLACSCANREAEKQLSYANALLDEHPDSALVILDNLNPEYLRGDAQRAQYALLVTRARYKCYVDESCDSLINTAVKYYERHGDTYNTMLSQYYRSFIYGNNGNYPQRMYSLLVAFDCASVLDDKFWKGVVASSISDVYCETFNPTAQLKYAKIEYENIRQTDDSLRTADAVFDIANSYNNIGEYELSIKNANQLLDSSKAIFPDRALNLLGMSCHALKKYDDAIRYFERLCSNNPLDIYLIRLGRSYALNGDIAKAESILNITDSANLELREHLRFDINNALGKTKEALESVLVYDSLADIDLSNRLDNDLANVASDYYIYNRQLMEKELRYAQLSKWMFAIISVMVIAIVIIVVTYRNRSMRAEYEKNYMEISELNNQLSTMANEHNGIIRNLLASKYELLNNLCMTYNEAAPLSQNKRVYNEVRRVMEQISGDKKKILEIEQYINQYQSNLITDFKCDLPDLKMADYMLFIYSVLGFSISSIAFFLKEDKVESVYNRKARLKNKIKQLDKSRATRYLSYLGA